MVAEVQRCAGNQFDPAVGEAFLWLVAREESGFIVNSARAVEPRSPDDLSGTSHLTTKILVRGNA